MSDLTLASVVDTFLQAGSQAAMRAALGIAFGSAVASVSYASTVTPAVNGGVHLTLTIGALTGALTLDAPSVTGTLIDGQTLEVVLQQDATGSRVVTFDSGYEFPTGGSSDVSAAANSVTIVRFRYLAAKSEWIWVGDIPGY